MDIKLKTFSFTLIEILVVATIISLLASGGMVIYSQFSKQARDAKRKLDLENVRAALEMYKSTNSVYPDGSWNDLNSFLIPQYLGSLPDDPKSTFSYYYESTDGSDYTIAAQLEIGGTTCVTGECGENCNYCLGPYGQK